MTLRVQRPRLRVIVLLLAVACPSLSAAEKAPAVSPLVVAHRGLLKHAPENTLAAFRAALALRTGFEFDVRRSGDGTLVCVHDATVDRTTDGRGPVMDLTVAELKRLDAGSWFDPAFRDERMATIEEIFTLLAEHKSDGVLAAADLKGDDPKIEADLVALAEKHGVLDRIVFIGRAIENADVRRRLKKASPKAQTAALASDPEAFDAALADAQADWIYVRQIPSRAQAESAHRAGKRLFIAGPLVAGHEEANWKGATEAGVDAILTDHPLELNRTRHAIARDRASQR